MASTTDTRIDKYALKQLSEKSFWLWIRDAVFDWTVIAAAFYLASIWANPLGYLMAVFVVGNRQHALALLGHDGTHFHICKNKQLNDFISDFIAFWPIGLTTSGYRNVHFEHHKHLNTENDPELMHRSAKAPQWDLPVTVKKVLRYALMDVVGYSISDYFMIITSARPAFRRTWVFMIIMHVLFLGVCIAFNVLWVAALWYASVITTFMMFFRLRTWLEHQGSDDTHQIYLTPLQGAVLAPHDSWHHFEHHQYPSVPLQRLHVLRKRMEIKAISLRDLIEKYRNYHFIRSGTALKKAD